MTARRPRHRVFKTFLVLAYMALEFCGHKHFVEYTASGQVKAYFGWNETCRDAVAPISSVLKGGAVSNELTSFLFERDSAPRRLRPASALVASSLVSSMLDRFEAASEPRRDPVPLAFDALSSYAPPRAALPPPAPPASPPQLLI